MNNQEFEDKDENFEENEDYSTSITIRDPLLEPYFIVKDRYCYALQVKTKTNPKYTVDGTSKESIKNVGYFANMVSCLKRIASDKVHFKKEYNSIKEYINEFNKIKQDSETFCKSFLDEE